MILTPKPPPTSGVMTSTLLSDSPSFAATAPRTPVEVWVELYRVSRPSPASHRASTPLPSNGIEALRSMSQCSSRTCGAAASARSTSPKPCVDTAATLPGTSGCTRCCAVADGSIPTTGGSTS